MGVDLLNIAGLKELEHQGPVVMVNLMRFHARSLDGDGTGWDAYLRYSALTVPMIKARGGTLLWTGDAKAVALGQQQGNQWDYLALVYYPSVAAFIDMMTSEDYETRCDPHRRNGCAEHAIIATARGLQQVQGGLTAHNPPSSPRTRGPIIPVVCCRRRSLHPCLNDKLRRMGPAFAGTTP
jgi:uncharacterized protein (DUF1330 family)